MHYSSENEIIFLHYINDILWGKCENNCHENLNAKIKIKITLMVFKRLTIFIDSNYFFLVILG